MNFKTHLQFIFRVRQYAGLPEVTPPTYVISAALVLVGVIAYFIGGLEIEALLRYSSLAASICGLSILLLHLIQPCLARWASGLATTLLVFILAQIWDNPFFLSMLVIPIFLSTILVNFPATLLTAGLQTFILTSNAAGKPVDSSNQTILLLTIWLAVITTEGGYIFIERLLEQASEDYKRLQDMLHQSRSQQQQLSFALEDLEHANRQLSLLYDKNISLRKAAEEATEAKSTYIARISHEIRTPLNMILGITESIIEEQDDYEDDLPLDLLDDIKVIRRNSEHLLSLVNDVLDLTRAGASRMILRKEWIDIAQEIDKSLEIVLPLARKKELDLKANITSILPQVYCDRTRIRQVILNLLSNAIRYTDEGEICIQAQADETWLTVQVRDTGPGVETGDTEKIFEPFYRGVTNNKQETFGTGLGLSVCRQLIDLHSGKIWLESQPGKGSVFSFRLPVVAGSEISASPTRFINEQWVWVERKRQRLYNFQTPEKRRVVIYGANELIIPDRNLLQEKVEIIQVDTIKGLAQEETSAPPHLAVINTHKLEDLLPFMQQAVDLMQDTPLIGCTFTSAYEQVRQAGAIDYVQKPFSNQRLRQAVEQVHPYPRKILVVDDNVPVQRLIVRILSAHHEDTQYFLAEDGAAALEVAWRKKPDLILLDLALPDIDGWQILRKIKEDPELHKIPVILISAHDLNDAPPRSKAVILMNGDGISLDLFHDLLQSGINH